MLSVSPAEQYFVYALNRARHDPVAYQVERSLSVDLSYVPSRPPLAINNLLMNSAEFKSTEMATSNYFGHTSSVTGQTANELVRSTGYALPSTIKAGGTTWLIGTASNQVESLAAGLSTADAALEALIVDAGINPPGHRIHLLGIDDFNAAAREIGVGYATNSAAYYRWYWTIHATLSTDIGPYLTGVAYADGNSNSRFNEGEGLGGVTITATGPTGTFSTTSIAAGGWTLKVPAGQYVVSASGGSFGGTSSAPITVGTDNVEVDFVSGRSNAWVDFTQFVNSAPVLSTATTPTLPPVVIGTANPAGAPVTSLLGSNASDVDALAARGIAITATTGAAFGTWQYSLDGAVTWISLGSPAVTSARLLRAGDLVRFLSAGGGTPGTASISYRAWDQTAGTAGGTADTTINGGTSAFSTAVATATATSVLTNTAPALAATGAGSFTSVAEDTASPSGTTAAQLLGSSFSDLDPGTPPGLVVTDVTGMANGGWSWSADDGATWTAIAAVSSATALPLRASDRLRFVPTANFNGTASVTYRGWDQSAGRAGVPVDLSTAGAAGGSTPFSLGSATASVTITPVNDAPTAVAGRSAFRLKPVAANTTFDSTGTTIADLLGNAVVDIDPGALTGVAIIGLGSGGSWYWNTGGSSWSSGTVSPQFATLLRSTDRLGFQPNSGFTGETTVTFRLWDCTTGSAGFNKADLSNPSASTGGTKAFGTEVFTARIFVGSAGSAPTAAFGAVNLSPDGRAVASIPVTFSRNVEGLDAGDFTLTRGGVAVPLTAATLTGSGTSFVLGNLGDATSLQGSYSLTLNAALSGIADSFGNRPAANATTTFSVAAEPLAPTDISLSATTIAENNAAGAVVGTFSTADADSTSFIYTLVAGGGSTDNAAFSISGNQLRATTSLDFETKASYSIRVRSTDSGGLFVEKAFTVTVTNVNEAPTGIALTNTVSSLREDTATAQRIKIADIVVTDDGVGTNQISVAGPDAAAFEIVGPGLYLKAGVGLSFKTKPAYAGTVVVGDSTVAGAAPATAAFSLALERTLFPTVSRSGSFGALTSTYGSASATTFVSLVGANLDGAITASAPSGFEVSSDGTTFSATATFTPVNGSVNGVLYARLAATAAVGTYSGVVTISTPGATAATAAIATSTVGRKAITITGLSAASRAYDGTTAASVSGTAALFGRIGSDDVAISGTALAAFADKNVGVGKPVTVSGFVLAGTAAANYTLTPLSLAANITARTLTVGAEDKTMSAGTAVPSLTATITGFVSGESAATAITGSASLSTTATAASPVGSYPITVTVGSLVAINGNYGFSFIGGALTVVAPVTFTPTAGVTIGVVEFGTTELGYAFRQSGVVRQVTYGGRNTSATYPGSGWTMRGVWVDGPGYKAFMRSSTGGFAVWTLSSTGAFVSSQTQTATQVSQLETQLNFDLNQNGTIGVPPSAPTGLIPTGGNARVSLVWTAPSSNGGAAVTDYVVQYSSNAGSTWLTFADGTSTTAAAVVTGLTNGTAYIFRVSAVNSAGTGTPSASTASVTPALVFTPTAGVTIGAVEFGTTELGYAFRQSGVVRQVTYNGRNTSATYPGSGWTMRGVWADGTGYKAFMRSSTGTFAVWTLSSAGAFVSSQAQTTTQVSQLETQLSFDLNQNGTIGTPATAPAAPTGLIPTGGNARVSLVWTAPPSNGGAAITDYVVQYSANSGSTWLTFADGTSTNAAAVVTGLTNGTAHIFRVSAVNSVGTGTPSASTAPVTPALVFTPTADVTIGTVEFGTTELGYAFRHSGVVRQATYNGRNTSATYPGSGWTMRGVWVDGTGYKAFMRSSTNTFAVWTLSSTGAFVSSQSQTATQVRSLETQLSFDLDQSGTIG